MTKIRILLVEDENVVREGFAALLRTQRDLEVVGEAANGLEAVAVAGKTRPDVVLLDLHMPKQDGLTTLPQLLELLPDCKVLVLTAFSESENVYAAIRSGALGFLLKDATRDQLFQGIRDVAAGKASLAPEFALKVIHEINHPVQTRKTEAPLTRREHETLKLIARGMTNHEIAEHLVVHERTVAKYVSNVLSKLHLASRTQAALYAVREGIATDTEPPEEDSPDR
jgi:NarL family two-component system response regulator LiaR